MPPVGPIQTVPRGLLGLLNLKGLGENPGRLLDDVTPQVDLMRLWLASSPEIVSAAAIGPIAAFGSNGSTIIVPNNEIWFVTEVMLASEGVLPAAATVDWAPGWRDITGAGFICGDYKAAGAGEAPQTGFWCNGRGFAVVPPGAEFTAHVRTFAGVVLWHMDVRFLRARQ